ncbi:MAG: protein kinase [Desulfomonile tiedjei]|uniref:Protein kinase n=1 Tax=Desulfomonile tiedjei TaxID=2358 RepID=A0A9D6V5M5_9BACT|nr:protein kinase [Desulfomonile tiedjei]
MESRPSYVSVTISSEASGSLSEKILGVLARMLNRTPDSVRSSLEIGTIKIKKLQLKGDLEKVLAVLRKNGLIVKIDRADEEVTERSLLRIPGRAPTAFSLTHARAEAQTDWKKGEVIEGLYEVRGSASGGMGTVYFVFHRLWKMMLAIKTPQRAAVKNEIRLLRFLREAELWVGLGLHPNIATCYYARVIAGLPRLFIEYVDGGTLDEWADRNLLRDLRTLTDLMLQFCHGMIYAEESGMIHRDIKPANCLITKDRIIKITDFGLVKRVDDPTSAQRNEDSDSETTSTGRYTDTNVTLFENGIMGSPRYMAPERFREKGKEDIRSDIYSFGIMLYELAVESIPFKLPTVFSLQELVRGHLKAPLVDPLSIRPELPRSLVEIMVTCLKKKPENRYNSFVEVCQALEAVNREMRPGRDPRNRPNLVGLKTDSLNNQAVSLLDLGRHQDARKLLEDAHSADTDHLEAVYNLHVLRWQSGETSDLEVMNRMESLRIELRETPDYAHLLGLISLQRGDPARAVALLKKASQEGSLYEDRWTAYGGDPKTFVNSLSLNPIGELASFAGHIKHVRAVALSSDMKRAYSVGEDRSIRIWDRDSGRCLKNFRTFTFSPVGGAFSPDDRLAATVYGAAFKTLDLWDLQDGKLLRKYAGMSVFGAKFSADSKYLAAFGPEGQVRVLDASSDSIIFESRSIEAAVSCIGFLGNREAIVVGCEDGTLVVVDFRSGKIVFRIQGHEGPVTAVDSTSDGSVILTGGADETLKLWNASSSEEIRRLSGHRKKITGAVLMADDRFIASTSADGTIKIWDGSNGRCFRTMNVAGDDFTCCALSANGKRLLTGSSRGSVRLWSIDAGWFAQDFLEPALCRPRTFREVAGLHALFNITVEEFNRSWKKGHEAQALEAFDRIRTIPGFCWSKEAILIRNVLNPVVTRGRLKSTSFIRSFHGHEDTVVSLKASPDSLMLLSGSLDGFAAIWDVVTGRRIKKFAVGSPLKEVFFLPRMQGLVTLSKDRVLRIWGLDGSVRLEIGEVEPPATMASTGQAMIVMSSDKTPMVADLATGLKRPRGVAIPGTGFVCFSENLATIYSLRDETRIQRWSLATGRNEGAFRDLGVKITSLMPTSSDDRVIAGMESGEVMVYVVGSGVNVTTLRGHTAAVRALTSTADGALWITASDDCSLRLWDIRAERCQAVLEGHSSPVKTVCLFPNMSLVASGSSEGNSRLWGLEWSMSLEESS